MESIAEKIDKLIITNLKIFRIEDELTYEQEKAKKQRDLERIAELDRIRRACVQRRRILINEINQILQPETPEDPRIHKHYGGKSFINTKFKRKEKK